MTIKPPDLRKHEIEFVTDKYLRGLVFNGQEVRLTDKPLVGDTKRVDIPALEFGNGRVLSVRESGLREFGRKKKEFFYSNTAGPYVKKKFDRQYFILPQSVHETFGKAFIDDIKREVQRLFQNSSGIEYDPIIVPYDDSVQRSVYNLGKEIVRAIDDHGPKRGFGIVMIPKVKSMSISEDELANLVMKELREREIHVSIIHTTVPMESYEHDSNGDEWRMTRNKEKVKRIRGYVRGVVLNKILLLNSIWPFVLKDRLRADLTIGIDVKNHVACFTFVYKTGSEIRFFTSETGDKEQLSTGHLRKKLVEFLRDEKDLLFTREVKNIVIHRQGRLFETEKRGIDEALRATADEGLISKDYACTHVEIKSTSRIPFRLFDVKAVPHKQKGYVRNPVVGTYVCDGNDAFLCNTGYPYSHKGTVRPLHVTIIEGPMVMDDIIADVFSLANLTWTKIDDCSREPLSVKMTDLRLREAAGEYDKDAYEFVPAADRGEGEE
jgi:hypothetical protein